MIDGIKEVGVVGAGTMGAGVAQVFADGRLSGQAAGHRRSAAEPRHGRDQEELRASGRARQAQTRGARCDAPAHRAYDQDRGSRRLRRRGRGRARALRAQEGGVREPRPRMPGRGDLRHQHLLDLGHPHRLDLESPRPRHRHALLQSRAGDAACRDHPRAADDATQHATGSSSSPRTSARRRACRRTATASSSTACSCR